MDDDVRKPYKVVMRLPTGQTTYTTESYPDIDAMFTGSAARYVAVFWRNWLGLGIRKDARNKYHEMIFRLTHTEGPHGRP